MSKESIIQEKLTTAQAAGVYELDERIIFTDDDEPKRIKIRRLFIGTPAFLFKVSLRKGQFVVKRLAEKFKMANAPTVFSSWLKIADTRKLAWESHVTLGHPEFLMWLKTTIGDQAYKAYAEIIA